MNSAVLFLSFFLCHGFFFCFGREKNERHGFSSLVHLLFFFLQKYGIALQHFFFTPSIFGCASACLLTDPAA